MRRFFWKFYDPTPAGGGAAASSELEVLKDVSKKIDQIKGDYEKEITTLKEAKIAADAKAVEFETKVKDLNTELAAKGATLGDIQNQVKELQAKSGHLRIADIPEEKMGTQQLLMKEWEKATDKLKEFRFDTHSNKERALTILTTKAVGVMSTANSVTGVSIAAIPSFTGEFAVRGRQLVHARDLMRTINTPTGLWMFIRQNTPTGEGSVGAASAPGAVKPTKDYDVTMVTVNSKYRAGIVDLAAEMDQDIPGMGQFITEEITEDYLQKETFDFMDTLVNSATGSSTLTTASTVTAEKIPQWVANLEQQNYQPDTIVVRPAVWAKLLITKPQDYSTPGGFVITPQGDIIFAGLRLVKCSSNALGEDKVLVGDFRKSIIVQKAGEGFRMEMFKGHDKGVYQNIITFRGEARAEIAVLRPDAFVYGGIGTT
ncbi:MAG TPA: phage major capsid protein [Cyclobacteriaceae bacterium]|nr:phage major capsid protein [Cyclobacteriaceae bacterium]